MFSKKLVVIMVAAVFVIAGGAVAVVAHAKVGTGVTASGATAKISADQAKLTAEKAAGGTASAVELDDEDGAGVYDVQVGNKEVKVDGTTGQILKAENEGADDPGGGDTSVTDHQD